MSDLFGDQRLTVDAHYQEPRVVYDGIRTFVVGHNEVTVGKATHTRDIVIGIVTAEGARHQFLISAQDLAQEGLRLLKLRREQS